MKRLGVILVLVLTLVVSVAPAVVGGSASGSAGGVVPDSYIVQLEGGASPAAVAAAHGLALGVRYTAVFNGFEATVPPGRLKALERDPRVVAISPNRIVQANPKPENPGKGNGGGGDEESGQVVPSGVQRIGAAPGSLAYTGSGVGVAILDTGIDLSNADLSVGTPCFTAYSSCQDGNGHGTHVAGIVAALDNTMDVVGVAPGATVYAVKVLSDSGSGTDAAVIAGLDWVLANASTVSPPIRVVNMSLGRPASGDDSAMHSAIAAVYDAGITVVASAGNNANVEASANVPAGFAEVLAIASTTAVDGSKSTILADTASYFTTDGPGIAVSAPGEKQEDVKGRVIFTVGILSLKPGGGTTRMSGTSMASPHVAGVVALVWDKVDDSGGTLSPADARARIAGGADRAGVAPLNSPTSSYTFDGVREGVLSAAGALQ